MRDAADTALPGPDPEAADDLERDQYVVFHVAGEAFAAPMAPVKEIVRVPDVVRMPLSPTHLLGLANLRGHVLPIVSLRRIFGLAEVPDDELTRAVVIDFGTPMGFVVDSVTSVVTVEPEQLEAADAIGDAAHSDLVGEVIRSADGMTMVLDFPTLIERAFADIRRSPELDRQMRSMEPAADADADTADETLLVSFVVDGQEYAIPIASVREIVQAPEQVTQMPEGPPALLGIMTLRNRLLPLVSLRQLFDLQARELRSSDRVVVVEVGSARVGLVMDRVSEVLRVPDPLVESMPQIMADASDGDIASICRLNDGKRLVSVIATAQLFPPPVMDRIAAHQHAHEEQTMQDDRAAGDNEGAGESQMVVFRLGDGEFGVPIESVQEIVRVPESLTRVPKSPDFVEGVINLRGTVLAVIDQRRRFGMADAERNDRQRIMVYLFNGTRTGFIVDSVAEVMKVPHSAIEESPKLSAEQSRLIRRVANLQDSRRLVMMIEPEQLLAAEELAALREMAA